jgi:hypothetical protein
VRLLGGAEALARLPDGSPAVVRHAFGRGRALYFTSFMGFALLNEAPRPVLELLRETVLAASAAAPFAEKGSDVHAAYHRAGEERLVYLVNASPAPQPASLKNQPARAALDLVSGEVLPSLENIPLGAWQYRLLRLV